MAQIAGVGGHKNKNWWIFKLNLLIVCFVFVAYAVYFVQSGRLDRYMVAFGFAEKGSIEGQNRAKPVKTNSDKKKEPKKRSARLVIEPNQ